MKNIANIITLFRVCSVVPIVVFMEIGGALRYVAGILFLAASFSDLLDGYLARARGEVTELGKLADPIADKMLLLAGLIPLVETGDVPGWLVVIIFAREFAVSGLRTVAASKGVVLSAGMGGKIKTVIYSIAVTALMLRARPFGIIMLYIGVLVSLLSAFNYFKENAELLS